MITKKKRELPVYSPHFKKAKLTKPNEGEFGSQNTKDTSKEKLKSIFGDLFAEDEMFGSMNDTEDGFKIESASSMINQKENSDDFPGIFTGNGVNISQNIGYNDRVLKLFQDLDDDLLDNSFEGFKSAQSTGAIVKLNSTFQSPRPRSTSQNNPIKSDEGSKFPYQKSTPKPINHLFSTPSPRNIVKSSRGPSIQLSTLSPKGKRTITPLKSPQSPSSKFITPRSLDGQTPKRNGQKKREILYSSPSKKTIRKVERDPTISLFQIKGTNIKRVTLKSYAEKQRHPTKLDFEAAKRHNIQEDVALMTSNSASEYKFLRLNEEGILTELGPSYFLEKLIQDGASSKLINIDWVENHYRWIVWKLASMERSFPYDYPLHLTPERVLSQLKYRYEKEINLSHRSALKKIIERDAFCGSHLVLCVAALVNQPNENNQYWTIEVTDGWYGIKAVVDEHLSHLISTKKIFPGMKLHVFGASIIGNDQPMSPLEIDSSTMLKIQYNGTRLARWYSCLGFQRDRSPLVKLGSLKSSSGMVPKIDVIVQRIYPILYVEKKQINDKSIYINRNAFGEDNALKILEQKREKWIDAKSFEADKLVKKGELAQDEISTYIKDEIADNPEFQRTVSASLQILVSDYPIESTDAFKVVSSIYENNFENGLDYFADFEKQSIKNLSKAVITLNSVDENILYSLKEGMRIRISYLSSGSQKAQSGGILRLSTTNYSEFKFNIPFELTPIHYTRECIPLENLVAINTMISTMNPSNPDLSLSFRKKFTNIGDFDTIGVVVSRDKPVLVEPHKSQQHLYITDNSMYILNICIKMNESNFNLKIEPGSILLLKNLSYRAFDNSNNVHFANANEKTEVLTSASSNGYFKEHFERIKQWKMSPDFNDILDEIEARICSMTCDSYLEGVN